MNKFDEAAQYLTKAGIATSVEDDTIMLADDTRLVHKFSSSKAKLLRTFYDTCFKLADVIKSSDVDEFCRKYSITAGTRTSIKKELGVISKKEGKRFVQTLKK